MQVNPYLFYNGNCEAALKFYEKVLGAKIEAMLTYEVGPDDMPIPPDYKKKIMHAKISIDDEVIMASDAPPGNFHTPQGSRRCRAPIQGLVGRWQGQHALRQDVFLQGFWDVRRSVRHALDGQLPDGAMIVYRHEG